MGADLLSDQGYGVETPQEHHSSVFTFSKIRSYISDLLSFNLLAERLPMGLRSAASLKQIRQEKF